MLQMNTNLKPKPRLISLQETATRLGLSGQAVRMGLAGTSVLTQIRPGGARRVLFIESEVEELIALWIRHAKEQTPEAAVIRRFGRRA
jgi:predicted DNA-binding transcriptional regulator AlpA